jgi:DNA-binding GntR family transcriptional regulator
MSEIGDGVHDQVVVQSGNSRGADGRIAEFVRSIYRGDRYRIMVDIFPNGSACR